MKKPNGTTGYYTGKGGGDGGGGISMKQPMGVSQWKKYGKKYGYWKYFRDEMVEKVEAMKKLPESKFYGKGEGEIMYEAYLHIILVQVIQLLKQNERR